MDTRSKGRKSEEIAAEFLQQNGYKFMSKNSFFKGGEIDLIMQDQEFIVFIEVKSLGSDAVITIYETLSKTKKHRLKNTINKWLLKNNKLEVPWRLDFVGIVYDNENKFSIEHFKFIDLN